MPVINITMGPADGQLKKSIIENVTKTMTETMNIPEKSFTVIIDEKDHESIGIGGIQISQLHK